MNKREFVLMMLSIITILLLVYKLLKNKKASLLTALSLLPALFISINKVSTFFTIDEDTHIFKIVDLATVSDNVLERGYLYSYRIILTIVETILLFIPTSVRDKLGVINLASLGKIIHWYACFLILVVICLLIVKFILNEKTRNNKFLISIFAVIYFYSTLCMPVITLGLKVANYDSLSSLLGVLAAMLIVIAIKQDSIKISVIAIMIAMLASMEKLMASPILFASMAVYIFIKLNKDNKKLVKEKNSKPFFIKNSLYYLAQAFIITLIINFIQFKYMFTFLFNGVHFPLGADKFLYSFYSFIQPLFIKNYGLQSSDAVFYTFIMLTLIYFSSLVLYYLVYRYNSSKDNGFVFYIVKYLGVINAALIIIFYLITIVSANSNPLKIAPMTPILEGKYPSTDIFDGWIYHFSAKSAMMHKFLFTAYHISVNFMTLPSVFIFVSFVFICAAVKKAKGNLKIDSTWIVLQIVLFISLCVPAAASIMGIPPGPRYQSLFILAMIISLIVISFEFLCESNFLKMKKLHGIILSALFCIFFIGELIPYYPNILLFTPVWYTPPANIQELPKVGNWYCGENMTWGEQNMIAGERIVKYANKNGISTKDIKIYSDYPTNWLNQYGISIQRLSLTQENYNPNAFYLFSRFKVFREETPEFLSKIEPIDAIKYKGQTAVWIYTGEQLSKYFQ